MKKFVIFRNAQSEIFQPSKITKNLLGIFVFGRPNKNEKSNKNFLANEKCPVCRPSLIFSLIRVFKNNVPCLRQCTICDEDMLSNLK